MVLERFPQLSFTHSDIILHVQEYARYAIKSIKTRIYKVGGGDGEYFGERTYRLTCWELYHRGIPIVTVKDEVSHF